MALEVKIYSFSYKRGFPSFDSEHGGGFLFDCRCLPNPGREDRYKTLTGLNPEVVSYLQSQPLAQRFANSIGDILVLSVESYLKRSFNLLEVGFGCTGGQHRSVYFAEWAAGHILQRFDNVAVSMYHKGLIELGYVSS